MLKAVEGELQTTAHRFKGGSDFWSIVAIVVKVSANKSLVMFTSKRSAIVDGHSEHLQGEANASGQATEQKQY